MHVGRSYSLREVVVWTRRETAVFLVIALVPVSLYALLGWRWLAMPWPPLAIMGTAVAFVTGFKNNASYSRLWEARQIWGGIVNNSRSWALLVQDLLPGAALGSIRQELNYRHLAWVTALRFQLREPRPWENMQRRHNVEYRARYPVAEWQQQLDRELAQFLPAAELAALLPQKGKATKLLLEQGRALRALRDAGRLSELEHLELERQLTGFLDVQGRCERIKNFPFPRQYATLNLFFIWIFIAFVPLGLLGEFHKLGPWQAWLTVPASVVVSWIFHTMDKIGDSSENPFEGSPNDVPITAMSRTIEIDLREALGETELPMALAPVNNILM